MCRDSSVGTETRYGLDGPEIEFQWGGEIFRTRPDQSWEPPSLLYNGYWVFFPGVQRPRPGADHPTPFSAEGKKKKNRAKHQLPI